MYMEKLASPTSRKHINVGVDEKHSHIKNILFKHEGEKEGRFGRKYMGIVFVLNQSWISGTTCHWYAIGWGRA